LRVTLAAYLGFKASSNWHVVDETKFTVTTAVTVTTVVRLTFLIIIVIIIMYFI